METLMGGELLELDTTNQTNPAAANFFMKQCQALGVARINMTRESPVNSS